MADILNIPELVAFLRASASRPFVWGECDCMLWMAEWVSISRGVDPAAYLRGTYSNALACRRIVADQGGEVSLATKLAADAGLVTTEIPMTGDVGLVRAMNGIVGAIKVPSGWVMKSRVGVAIARTDALIAWGVHPCQQQ